jgi:hypothetical protein
MLPTEGRRFVHILSIHCVKIRKEVRVFSLPKLPNPLVPHWLRGNRFASFNLMN